MLSCIDQIGNSILLSTAATRIVSLVPSQTELLYYLNLDEKVVGITKFCIQPLDWFNNKTKVGGTKTVNVNIVHDLRPDLVIANKEENAKTQVAAISNFAPVYTSDVNNLDDALQMIESVGELTDTSEPAEALVTRISMLFSELPNSAAPLKTAYLIWSNPYMAAAKGTFIHDMMTRCGFVNVFDYETRYPQVSVRQLADLNCELLLLSTEPYPFTDHHVQVLREKLPNTRVMLVDGDMFSWYGSRLIESAKYFSNLFRLLAR